MLRVVLLILAVAAVTLAIVLGHMLLYVLAAALIIAAGLLTTRKLRKAHNDIPESFMKAPQPPEVDLSTLGIVDIRPKTRSTPVGDLFDSVPTPPEQESVDSGFVFESTDDGVETAAPELFPEIPATAVSQVKTRRKRATIVVSQASSRRLSTVLLPAMTSLRASLNAYTVCLLRPDIRPLRYHVEAVVSQNSYARAQGTFVMEQALPAGGSDQRFTIVPERAGAAVPAGLLGHYHEHIPIERMAIVHFPSEGDSSGYVLLADSMEPDTFDSAQAVQMLEQYVPLIETIPATEATPVEEARPATPSGSEVVRPRREIIREEMEVARTSGSPLALGLVFLNSGEKMAGATSEQIDIIETEFELRLKAVAGESVVEHFGELTYGVFYHGDPGDVADWAANLQSSFDQQHGLLEGGVSVGVAVLGDRHEGPDEFRAEATAALKEAFDTGECTVVG